MTGRQGGSGRTPDARRPGGRRALFGRSHRGRLVAAILVGTVVGVVVWFSGMDTSHAIGLAAVVAAGGSCLALLGERPSVQWPDDPVMPREGARREVAQLGWAVQTRGGTVTPEAVRHLRSVTAQTLALRGIDLDDPDQRATVDRIIGPDVAAIVRRGSAEAPRTAVYESVIALLERVAADPAGRVDVQPAERAQEPAADQAGRQPARHATASRDGSTPRGETE